MTTSPITLSEASKPHLVYLERMRGLATGTVKNYGSIYSTFGQHIASMLGREALASDITEENVISYFSDYVAVHAPATFGPRRSNMTAIVRWMMKAGHIPVGLNFVEDLPLRKTTVAAPRRRRLSDAEFLRLLEVSKNRHPREYHLLLFARLAGRRCGEIMRDRHGKGGIVWADILWDEGHILWDNNKGRELGAMMPLTPRLRVVLEAWRAVYCRELGVDAPSANWLVFPALKPSGRPVGKGQRRPGVLVPMRRTSNPDKVIKPLLQEAGLWRGPGDGWHVLRRSFGNQRKQAASNAGRGDAWEMAQNALRHKNIATTRAYVDPLEDYDRYAAWAMETPELDEVTMLAIPELASLAINHTAQTLPAPAFIDEFPIDDTPLAEVIDFGSRRARRAI